MLTENQHENAIHAGIEAAVEEAFREKRDTANGAWRIGALVRLRSKMGTWKAAASPTLTTAQVTETVREVARLDALAYIAERAQMAANALRGPGPTDVYRDGLTERSGENRPQTVRRAFREDGRS